MGLFSINIEKEQTVNTITPNFQIRYNSNYNNNKQTDKTVKNEMQFQKPALAKPSTENLRANYMVSFQGGMRSETSDMTSIGTLNHQTAFFREPRTDELVQKYVLDTFSKDKEINIVSGACSTGEEVRSYAMMLDNLKDKLKVYGFDISDEVIEDAQSGECQLLRADDGLLGYSTDIDSENMLFDDNPRGLNEYQQKCCDKFKEYYTQQGSEYRVPIFPDAKRDLMEFEAMLNNPIEFAKKKKQYNDQIQQIKKIQPKLAENMKLSFEDTIKISREALEKQVASYRMHKDFSANLSKFDNCIFTQGDVMNLDKMYPPKSVNVLLYRNALYHTLCVGDNMVRCMKEDAREIMDEIAQKMNKVLKPQGLVVFGEEEYLQGIRVNTIADVMKKNGFRLLNKSLSENIWLKVR